MRFRVLVYVNTEPKIISSRSYLGPADVRSEKRGTTLRLTMSTCPGTTGFRLTRPKLSAVSMNTYNRKLGFRCQFYVRW